MLEGMLVGIERGYFQSEIAEAAFREQELYEKGRLIKVGVNDFVSQDDDSLDILQIPVETEARQLETLRKVRSGRDAGTVEAALSRLSAAAATDENLIPLLVDCARASCSEGEIVETLQRVFGTYTEAPRF
jgi:methylmalonyl-CoA mutase N-terminal domain/subunit